MAFHSRKLDASVQADIGPEKAPLCSQPPSPPPPGAVSCGQLALLDAEGYRKARPTRLFLPCWAFYALCPVSPCVTVPRPRRLSMPGHWSAEHSALLASVVLCYTRESLPAVISKNLSSQDCISAACKSHFPKSGGMPTLLRGGPRDVTNNNQCRKC